MLANRSRVTSKFRPMLAPCESRVLLSAVPGSSKALAASALVSSLPVQTLGTTYIGTQVLAFAKKNLGNKVGDGECATLAAEAVKAAKGVPFDKLGPTGLDANYVWGKKVTTISLSNQGFQGAGIQPGDIIQFRDVKISKSVRTDFKNGGWQTQSSNLGYGHHTAIVSGVNGDFVDLLQQNVGPNGKSADAKKIVQTGTIWARSFTTTSKDKSGNTITTTYKFTSGTMWVYRPYK
jgi:hypothetical protein